MVTRIRPVTAPAGTVAVTGTVGGEANVGDTVTLTLTRNGSTKTLRVTLGQASS